MWLGTVTVGGKVSFKSAVVEKWLGTAAGETLNLPEED